MKSGKINADYSGFTLEKGEKLELNADYTNSEIQDIEEINYNSDYGKVVIGKAAKVVGVGDYVTHRIGTITGSLNLILGMRADKSMIRTGETKCTVEATFQLEQNSPIFNILDSSGIDMDDNLLTIRRIISKAGTKNIINDFSTSLNTLKKIGDYFFCIIR
jgi:hypothetical protein